MKIHVFFGSYKLWYLSPEGKTFFENLIENASIKEKSIKTSKKGSKNAGIVEKENETECSIVKQKCQTSSLKKTSVKKTVKKRAKKGVKKT